MSDTVALRLNIGGGSTTIPGYVNWDVKQGNLAHDIKHPDGSVDAIYASHVLEHYPYRKVDGVLAHWAQKLRPGGTIHIAVPDADYIDAARRQTEGTGGIYQAYAFGGGIDEHDHHGCLFDYKMLTVLLQKHGFEAVERFQPFVDDCSKLPVSLNVTATKRPPFAITAKPKVFICLSQPRLSITATTMALIEAVRATSFDHGWESSIYWEKGISTMFKRAIEAGYDYVMTVDYDGLFHPQDVHQLVKTMQDRPDLAAIFPVQMSRHENKPLVFQPHLDYTGDLTVTPFGHFGLTLIRTQMLKSLPKPWMHNIPGPDGDWETHPQSDADITFWRNLSTNGHKVAQHNKVILGHIVEAVRWPTKQGGIFQPLPNYLKIGKPDSVEFNADAFRKGKDKKSSEAQIQKSQERLKKSLLARDPRFGWLDSKLDGWQCGEQGLLVAIAEKLGLSSGLCVEIGAGDGQELPLSCQRLIDKGWDATVVERNKLALESLRKVFAKAPKVRILDTKATTENIGSFVPRDTEILTIDVDSTDYFLWQALATRPQIVMVEHHNLGDVRMTDDEPFVPPYALGMHDEDGGVIQANYLALDRLAHGKGYSLIARTSLNSLYARNDVAPKLMEDASTPKTETVLLSDFPTGWTEMHLPKHADRISTILGIGIENGGFNGSITDGGNGPGKGRTVQAVI